MPWDQPTLKQLYERISQDFSGRLLDGSRLISRSVVTVLSKVWAGAAHALHAVLAWLYLQVFVDTAEGPHLERWAAVWGLGRKAAAPASGEASGGGEDGGVIPAGYILIHKPSGQQCAVQAEAEISGGAVTLELRAVQAGAAGSLPAGTPLSLAAPLDGVRSDFVVGPQGLSGGAEAEGDDELRARLLERLRKPPRGGSRSDYAAWAKEVAGVTRAWCYPLGAGIGTVTLTFVADNDPAGPIPSAELVERVQAHIDDLRPASVKDFLAFAPAPVPVDITLSVTPDTDAVRQAVRAELADLVADEAAPDTVIYLSHLNQAVSLAPGEEDHTLHQPTANLVIGPGQFPLLGEITFVDEAGGLTVYD